MEALGVVGASWDAGLRYFDTAPWYGLGLSESHMGLGLHDRSRGELAGTPTLLHHGAYSTGILDLCEEYGISVVLGGPFNSGILATWAVEGAKYYYSDASLEIVAKVQQKRWSATSRASIRRFRPRCGGR